MTKWDQLRFVLALGRHKTIRSAARALHVNHATVARKLHETEHAFKTRLFEQTPKGYIPTPAGLEAMRSAEQMEAIFTATSKKIESADNKIKGEVFLHMPDVLMACVSKRLAKLSQLHRGLCINVCSDTKLANLEIREADIALRFCDSPPEDMVGRKIAELPVALYGAIDLIRKEGDDITQLPWVRWHQRLQNTPIEQDSDLKASGAPIVARVDTYQALNDLVSYGAGIGYLCPWFANSQIQLQQLSPEQSHLSLPLWLLTHPDLRGVKRVSVIKETLEQLFQETH